jgi:hypothetical protein
LAMQTRSTIFTMTTPFVIIPSRGERILGRSNLQALRSHHPGKPSGFAVKRILGNGNLWITEYTITYQGRLAYTVSIMEFRNGKVVRETQYFGDPFEAPGLAEAMGLPDCVTRP